MLTIFPEVNLIISIFCFGKKKGHSKTKVIADVKAFLF